MTYRWTSTIQRPAGWLIAVALLVPAAAAGQEIPSPLTDPLRKLPPEEARQVLQWAADWVQQSLPEAYHGEKNWGKKTRVYAGMKVDFKDGRLKTQRRWKDLGHGRWLRYGVHLRDPTDPARLDVRITRAEQGEDQRIHFDAQIDTLLDLDLHQERWNLGTRLFSVSVKAEAKLRMIIGGDVADSFGDLAKQVIRTEYLPRQQEAITGKLNAQIDRRRDRLRFGASHWISRSLPIR